MLEFIRRHSRWVLAILFILIVPSFVFFGIESYTRDAGSQDYIAKIDRRSALSQAEFSQAWRNYLDQIRQAKGENFDISQEDTPENRQLFLDQLIDRMVVQHALYDQKISVTDKMVVRQIVDHPQPEYETNGRFNKKKYTQYLHQFGIAPEQFESQVRYQLAMAQVLDPALQSSSLPAQVSNTLGKQLAEKRDVALRLFEHGSYEDKVKKPSDAELKAWYDQHQDKFRLAKSASVDYIVLNEKASLQSIKEPDDADLKSYFETNRNRFTKAERRDLSHIQFNIPKGSSSSDIDKIREKAEQVAEELRADPSKFAALAKEYSEDSGSKNEGGHLGTFSKGDIPQLDEAAFDGKGPGIRAPLQVEDAIHIVKVEHVDAGEAKSFDEVKEQLKQEVRLQLASEQFSKLSNELNDQLGQHREGLKEVADSLKLPLQHLDNVTPAGVPQFQKATPEQIKHFSSKPVLDSVFSEEVFEQGQNSNVIEVSSGELLVLHVSAKHGSHVPDFDDIKEQVAQAYLDEKASELAEQEGKRVLEAIQSGGNPAALSDGFDKPVTISRVAPLGLPAEAIDAIMGKASDDIPGAVGFKLPNAYVVAYIKSAAHGSDADLQSVRNQLLPALNSGNAAELQRQIVAELRKHYKVKIDDSAVKRAINPHES